MTIVPVKTHKITAQENEIFKILDRYITNFGEKNILVVTSKIISICEGRLIKIGTVDKKSLIKQEADYYIQEQESKYGFVLTIKEGILAPSAGVDESNGNGYYILWPSNPQKIAHKIRKYLARRFGVKKAGVIITDSKTSPLRWGTTGVCIAYSGFLPLNNLIGTKDIFGRPFHVTKVNVADGLAAAAVVVMGEGKEQTPLALISDVPFVKFVSRSPAKKELSSLSINIKDDLYGPLLSIVEWKKGGHTQASVKLSPKK